MRVDLFVGFETGQDPFFFFGGEEGTSFGIFGKEEPEEDG